MHHAVAAKHQSPLQRQISANEVRAFWRDGVLCLRSIISPEWVAFIREGIEEVRAEPGLYATVFQNERSYSMISLMASEANSKLRKAVFESGVSHIARAMLGDKPVRLVQDQIFYKAGFAPETPWHQDTNGGGFDGDHMIRVWTCVDPAPRDTALEVVRGSHLWNARYRSANDLREYAKDSSTTDSNYFKWEEEPYPRVPDIEAHRDSFDIIGFDVEPGDVIVFNFHALHHAGAGHIGGAQRRAFTLVFGDDTTTLAKRPNMVPSMIDVSGRRYEIGQSIAEFPDLFPSA